MNKSSLRCAVTLSLLILSATAVAAADDVDGKALYERKCAMCHGKDGVARSLAKGSGNFNDAGWQESRTLEVVIETITKGKGKMPKNEDKLSTEEIKAIAEYVKKL